MITNDIIFQLKKGIGINAFEERYQFLVGIYKHLHNIEDPVERYKNENPQMGELTEDENLFWEKIYPEMPEPEKKLYRTYIIKELSDERSQEIYEILKEDSRQDGTIFEYVQHSFIYEINHSPLTATNSTVSWGIGHLQCPEAWKEAGSQGDDVVVAVIDTGVNYNHEYIKNNMWVREKTDIHGNPYIIHGYDFINNNEFPLDEDGHGTLCAGIIAAENRDGVQISVAPKAKIMALKISGNRRPGIPLLPNQTDTPLGALAIVYAADNGARILSNSWQWRFGNQHNDDALKDAINHAHNKNCIVVFAAGNMQLDIERLFPTNHEKVISVAAITQTNFRSTHSNWGNKVTISAPGEEITSLAANDNNGFTKILVDGTSLACPHVSGLIAIMLELNDSLSFDQIKKFLCDPGFVLPPSRDGNPLGNGKGAHALFSVRAVILNHAETLGRIARMLKRRFS